MRKLQLFGLQIAVCLSLALGICQAQSVLTHHVRQATQDGSARFVGSLSSTQAMRLVMTLPLQNQEELDQLIKDLYDPTSPSYHQFLTVEQFTEKFGPTQAQYDAAVNFAQANGLAVVGTSPNRLTVQVTGNAANVQSAFHVKLGVYQHPTENRTFFAPDREPTTGLSMPLWHVGGLDNFSTPKPAGLTHTAANSNATANATAGSGPAASFLGSDMRAAYYGGTLTGAGQVVGLLEFYGTDLADLQTYYANAKQTYPGSIITLLSTDGTSTSCVNNAANYYCDDTEQTLDMTQALGMAPGLSGLVVFVGYSDSDIFNSMATHKPLALNLSSSWTWDWADPSTDDPFFKEFAAQGQNLFQAAGDSGKWTSPSAIYPADDAYVTSVGGTDLTTKSGGGAWSSETVWSSGGGGISPDKTAIPSWQVSTAASCPSCSQSYRNGPDVSANANYTYYVCADQTGCTANEYGGTSFAAPLWAGYLALVNQQRAINGNGPVGFINPTLYQIGNSTAYSAAFHDITSGSNGYTATTGYDLATGWGSPNGAGLLNALTGTVTSGFTVSAQSTNLSIVAGSSGSATIVSTTTGNFNSPVSLSATGQPSGVTVSFSPASITGTGNSVTSIAVGSTVAAGTYNITVKGTSGSTTSCTVIALTVTGSFSISVPPSSANLSIVAGSSGSATIASTTTGNFNSAVSLSATGQPSGVTVSFSPASITGTGNSATSIAVGSTVAAGTYNITVKGTYGSTTSSAVIALTVTAAPGSFGISVSPSSANLSIVAGSSGSATIVNTTTGNFKSPVSLTASGQPSGVTVSFSPASITGTGNSAMSIAVGSTVAAGTYNITVQGTSGSITSSTVIVLTVTGSFSISVSPSSANLSIAAGGSGSATIASTTTGNFKSPVSLTASGQPSGVTVSFSPASIAGTGNSAMSIAVGSTVVAGTYNITVKGTYGSTTSSTVIALTVPGSFSISISPSPANLSIVTGGSGSATIVSTTTGNFKMPVSLSESGQPFGVTVNLSTATITGTGSSVVSIAVGPTVAAGTYNITVKGTYGPATSSAVIALTVTAAPCTFSISASPGSAYLLQGQSGSVTVTTTLSGSFKSAVSLSATGVPSGVTASFSPASIAAPGSGSALFNLTVSKTASAGTYPITITGTGGGVTKTTTFTFLIVKAGSAI